MGSTFLIISLEGLTDFKKRKAFIDWLTLGVNQFSDGKFKITTDNELTHRIIEFLDSFRPGP
jgi:hypothetical protein